MSGIGIVELSLIALGLSADCFAVALSGSIAHERLHNGKMLRTAAAFGLAQFLMLAIGWFAGRTVVDFITAYDHWVVFTLLAIVGGRMIWESVRDDGGKKAADISRGVLLLTMAVATSIDALAVGLTFAFLDVNILGASAAIGIVAFAITCVGFLLGVRAGKLLGKRAKLIGGLVLIGIGVRVLITHMLGQ